MSFLDDIKRQAQAQQSRQQIDTAALARNAALVEAACHSTFKYWLELAQQLNVLQPVSPSRYRIDAKHVLESLKMTEFRVDARRQQVHGPGHHSHVQLLWMLRSGQQIELSKDMPHEIERLEKCLRQAGVDFESENLRDPDNGRYLHTRMRFVADCTAGVRLEPLHDEGLVRFHASNIEGFGTVVLELPAFEVGQRLLDDMARWMLGHPSPYLQAGRLVRRD